jgi:hypothetical protein
MSKTQMEKELMQTIGRDVLLRTRLSLLLLGPLAALFPGMTSVFLAKAIFRECRKLDPSVRVDLSLFLEELVDE